MSKQSISKLERGIYSPSIKTLMEICEILNTPSNELMNNKLNNLRILNYRKK
ncbi:helix-turn-helix domain-containing protein [Neobacillus massiliamazoniensis]|uniref:helix-turn-helix domain-containing protein n=1 Tax=Neobacillus massiliamazoniensis TaxID=1499688 RepID=UPI000A418300